MSVNEEIRRYIARKIGILQNGSQASKADLARLRRGLGKDIPESIESWQFVYSDLPESLSGKTDAISESEKAVHLALTLYAMHQQGTDRPVHIRGIGFGDAMSNLISQDKGNEDAVIRRFNSLISSDGLSELSIHLRSMIQLIKSSDKAIGLDYEELASDLYYFQFPDGKRNLKIKWGKHFYRQHKEDKESEESK